MTLVLLTLILLGYMKITGKTIPLLERRLNKVKNAKKNTNIASTTEIEIKNIDLNSTNNAQIRKTGSIKPYKNKTQYNYVIHADCLKI